MRIYLHSTMFLLIRQGLFLYKEENQFTFHNVSINTEYDISGVIDKYNLHSTMFLLIHTGVGWHQADLRIYIPQCFY